MASKKKSHIFEKKRKKKPVLSSSSGDKDELTLQNVVELGGDEDDYELLKNVADEDDFATGGVAASEQDGVKKTELQNLIKELGLQSFKNQSNVNKLVGNDNTTKSEKIKAKSKESTKPKKSKKKPNENFTEAPALSHGNVTDKVVGTEPYKDKLLIHPAGRWFEQSSLNPSATKKQQDLESAAVEKIKKTAETLLENESAVFRKERERSKPSNVEWLKTVANSGTLGDKIAALALQIQDSPLHHLKTLDILLNMASKKGRRECLMAIDTLKDLWIVNLLPDDRKLKRFSEFSLSSAPQQTNQSGRDAWNRKLIIWYFEDQLKQRYESFVVGMERLLHDNLENVRNKVLGVVFELLSEKPEQEKKLLLYLVNKVGDPNRKIASKASYLLGCLVQKHPNMKKVITQEVERLLYRSNIGLKAQYYAVCFLNQLILAKKDSALASNLITIYFSLFKAFVDKGQVETKMLSALLSGVNRAFHYVQDDDDQFSDQVNMLFRVVHITSFNTSVQALMLLFQVMDSRQSISDRFYQALYSKLLDPHLRMSSKQAMFLNVIYKSLKIDTSLKRVKAFVKRLLQVCSTQPPALVCGVLYLLSEVAKVKPGIKSLVTQPEELDEEEHFTDVIDTTEDANNGPSSQSDVTKEPNKSVHVTSSQGHVFVDTSRTHGYQADARNPLYCGADNSCLWEVVKLSRHYHPSVSRFAQNLLQGEDITYDGDPLSDFTLMRFLDRFVYKNPKKKAQDHGGSLMQPKSVSQRQFEQPVNTAAFLNKKEGSVREDELFFYKYFKQKAEEEQKKIKKDEKNDGGEREDEISDEFADENIAMDFAREFEKSQTNKPRKGKQIEGSDEDISDEEGFDYGEMQFSDDEMVSDNEQEKYTEKDYEKALLENLSSDEFSDHDDEISTPKKKQKLESSEESSMFADAEEFAHLLEDSGGGISQGGSEDIDMRGASWKQQQWEMSRMHHGNSSHKNKFRGGKSRGRGSRNFGQGSAGFGKSSGNVGEGRKNFAKGRGKPNNRGNKRRNTKRNSKRK